MVMTRVALVALSSIAAMKATGASAQTSALPNWVGPKIGRPIDTACYRKTQRSNQCPLGYDSDKLGGCWAQCPLEYPVACGMECIPQSKDCTLEVITKIGAVANVAINLASSNMFSSLISSNVSAGLKCGGDLFTVVNKIVQLVGTIQKATPDLPTEKIVLELLKSEVVTSELTAAVVKCAGAPTAVGSAVSAIVKLIVERIAANGSAVLAPNAFIQLTKDAGLGSSISALGSSDLAKFKELISNGPACGMQLKNVLDRIVAHIVELKKQNSKITPEQIRIELTKTSLFLKELPALTSHCGSSATSSAQNAFDIRDTIRNALQGFIDKVIDAAYQNGNPVPVETYIMVAANLGLDALSGLDSTGIVKMVAEFLQPICGPTSMIGEIDDGPAALALGLRTVDNAFNGSYGHWTKSGDGQVKIVFESKDTQDVTVNVWSGGSQIGTVPVGKGQRAEWAKPIADLQDKTLYLDRWRPGFLGLPGTGGGSLLAWVPRSSTGGHLELTAQLNVS